MKHNGNCKAYKLHVFYNKIWIHTTAVGCQSNAGVHAKFCQNAFDTDFKVVPYAKVIAIQFYVVLVSTVYYFLESTSIAH